MRREQEGEGIVYESLENTVGVRREKEKDARPEAEVLNRLWQQSR